ncbi:hypothetical protein BH11GEM1_BH11GEM1_16680 [soil metagenome]
MRRCAFLSFLAAVLPFCAGAQGSRVPDSDPHISPALGVHYGSPLRLSLAAGVMVDASKHRNDGLLVMVEPGLRGGELSVGYFRMFGQLGSGYSVRAAALRTRDDPWNASPNTTYAGGEGQLMIAFGVGLRAGYLRRVSRRVDDSHDNLATVGVSIGL